MSSFLICFSVNLFSFLASSGVVSGSYPFPPLMNFCQKLNCGLGIRSFFSVLNCSM